jgi:hypothetical protein
MRIIILLLTYLLLSASAHAVIELSKDELKEYSHIKKIPIAFANWGKKQHEIVVDPKEVCMGVKDGVQQQLGTSRKLKITKNKDQINFATKCNKWRTGYKEFLRTYTDEWADRHCNAYDRAAIYVGEASFKAQPLSRIGQLAAGVYSFGLGNTKMHVSASYFCSLEQSEQSKEIIAYKKEMLEKEKLEKQRRQEALEKQAAIEIAAFEREKNELKNHNSKYLCDQVIEKGKWVRKNELSSYIIVELGIRDLNAEDCTVMTGRYDDKTLELMAMFTTCETYTFTPGTEAFANCVLDLEKMKHEKELAQLEITKEEQSKKVIYVPTGGSVTGNDAMNDVAKEMRKMNRREGLKEMERQFKKSSCILNSGRNSWMYC